MTPVAADVQERDDAPRAAVVVITDPAHEWLVLQRKDEHYPVEQFRGALACFGGQIEPGEGARAAIRREVTEEIADPPLRADILGGLRHVGEVITSYGHHVTVYAVVLADLDAHADRITRLPPDEVCAEGLLEIRRRQSLAGQPFAWDTDLLLRYYLQPALGQEPW
jgi:8-oxo-dGTP pyrophosphatase MutT (NUDIX family)